MSPDGRRLVFRRAASANRVFTADLGATGLTAPITAPPRPLIEARGMVEFDLSPDGRFLAYSAPNEGLFVTTFPSAESKWEMPVGQAVEPRWSADGSRLFAVDALGHLVETPVNLKGAFTAGRPEVRLAAMGGRAGDGYDLSRDGRSLLIPLPPAAIDTQTRILVIQNWRPK